MNNINLRNLPAWLQYLIALTVVALVGGAAWLAGRDDPLPAWVTSYLIPAITVLYVALLAVAVARRLRRK